MKGSPTMCLVRKHKETLKVLSIYAGERWYIKPEFMSCFFYDLKFDIKCYIQRYDIDDLVYGFISDQSYNTERESELLYVS